MVKTYINRVCLKFGQIRLFVEDRESVRERDREGESGSDGGDVMLCVSVCFVSCRVCRHFRTIVHCARKHFTHFIYKVYNLYMHIHCVRVARASERERETGDSSVASILRRMHAFRAHFQKHILLEYTHSEYIYTHNINTTLYYKHRICTHFRFSSFLSYSFGDCLSAV